MTSHNIRNAFALASMTPELEAIIGEHMRDAARREGNFPAMPREFYNAEENELTNARVQVGILEFLAHGPASKREIRYGMGGVHTASRFNRQLEVMVAAGQLEIVLNGRTETYAIPHSPTSGDCVPALPGKPKAGPVPSIVTKPQGSDRPCGVEARG